MANQRMYVACEVCFGREETTLEESWSYLGKYYPESGWYDPAEESGSTMGSRFMAFLEKHKHGPDDERSSWEQRMFGKWFRIIYDSEVDKMGKERDEILRNIRSTPTGIKLTSDE